MEKNIENNMENNTKNIIENNEKEHFDNVYQTYKETKNKLHQLEKEKRLLEKELRNIEKTMQKRCNHVFIREVTTSGCYREVHNICSICGLWA